MPETNTTGTDSDKPSWDSSQFTQRAWIDDLLPWLPTCNSAYASLIEHGYTLTPQGRVVAYSYSHAQAVSSIFTHLNHLTCPPLSCLPSASLRLHPPRRRLDRPRVRHPRAPRRHRQRPLLNPLEPFNHPQLHCAILRPMSAIIS
eukprot:5871919-Pleurochrysis_carterae.AAC.5